MFSVIVTERGEASETLNFEQAEVTIGRVRGNDIVLRKGSVSKRHAKILAKDGKFVVIDLKSTNGTIVNGRKINAPQVVRPSDKLVIGDYVLEVSGVAVATPPLPPEPPEVSAGTPAPPAIPTPAPASIGPPALDSPQHVPFDDEGRVDTVPGRVDDAAATVDGGDELESIANIPVSRTRTTLAMRVPRALFRDQKPATQAPRRLSPAVYAAEFRAAHEATIAAILRSTPAEDLTTHYPPTPGDRTRAERSVELAVRGAGSVDAEALTDVLMHELTGLGPLEFYFDDPDVSEVHVNAYNAVYIKRSGTLERAPLAFGSRDTLMAVARRIAVSSNLDDPLGGAVRLPDGTRIELVMPPAASGGPVISAVRPQTRQRSAEALISDGVASREILTALEVLVSNGGSVVVSSVHPGDATAFIDALAQGVAESRRTVAVETVPSLSVTGPAVVRLSNVPDAEPSSLQRALSLDPEVLIVDPFSGDMIIDWLLDGSISACGFVASFGARNVGEAMSRLVLMALQGRASDADAVRRQLSSQLDVFVQLRRSHGRSVVGQVMDVVGVDVNGLQTVTVFQSKVGPGGLEFHATGHVPRFFSELSDAGVSFDTSIFNT